MTDSLSTVSKKLRSVATVVDDLADSVDAAIAAQATPPAEDPPAETPPVQDPPAGSPSPAGAPPPKQVPPQWPFPAPPKAGDPPPSTGPVVPVTVTDPPSGTPDPIDEPAPAPVDTGVPPATDPPAQTPPATDPIPPTSKIVRSARVPAAAGLTPDAYGAFVSMRPGYLPSHVSEATLAGLSLVENPRSSGEMTTNEPDTGYRRELGERAYAAQLFATTLDPRAKQHMYAEADLSATDFAVHDYIADVDGIPKPWLWSLGLPDNRYVHAYDGKAFVRVPDPLWNGGVHVDFAHQPEFLMDATCMAGIEGDEPRFLRYVDEMKWWASKIFFDLVENTPQYIQGTKCIFSSYRFQQRENGWNLGKMDNLLHVLEHFLPDDEWIPWLAQVIEENVRFNDGVHRTGDYDTTGPTWQPWGDAPIGAYKNPWGITRAGDAYDTPGCPTIAPWQQGFQSQIVARSYNRDHPSLSADFKALHKTHVVWLGNFWTLVLGAPDDPASYDYRRAVLYTLQTGRYNANGGIDFFQTPAEFYAQWSYLGTLPPDDRILRGNYSNEPAGFPTGFLDDCVPAICSCLDAGADQLRPGFERLKGTVQWRTQGGDLAFSWLDRGDRYDVDGPAPAATQPAPPAPTLPAPPPAPPTGIVALDLTLWRQVAPEGGFYLMPEEGLVAFGADDKFVVAAFDAGFKVQASNQLFGLDPDPNVVKALYVLATAAVAPTPDPLPTPIVPVAPSPTPIVVPAPVDDGSEDVDPKSWLSLVPEGAVGRIPFKNTLRQCLPDFLQGSAQNWLDIWPAFALIVDTDEIAGQNGGHTNGGGNMGATTYASLRKLTFEARNCAPAAKAEELMLRDGYPDEFGVHFAMHGYIGYYYNLFKRLLVLWTMYGDGRPIRTYDVTKKMGGGGTYYDRDHLEADLTYGGYGMALHFEKLKGAFVGDAVVSVYQPPQYAHKIAFVPDDMGPVRWGWPSDGDPQGDANRYNNPIDAFAAQSFAGDQDNLYAYLISMGNDNLNNGPAHDPILRVWSVDPTRADCNRSVDFPLVGLRRAIEPNRSGFVFVRGKGLCGIDKVSDTVAQGIQVIPGKNPMLDAPTWRVVYENLPASVNGVWGSHVAVDEINGVPAGGTYVHLNVDEQPLWLNWPSAAT